MSPVQIWVEPPFFSTGYEEEIFLRHCGPVWRKIGIPFSLAMLFAEGMSGLCLSNRLPFFVPAVVAGVTAFTFSHPNPAHCAGKAAPEVVLTLAPSETNPRNSEGDFISLKDGRILLIYTHFTGGGGDNSTAHLASRVSTDHGVTWSDSDELVLANEGGENVMSVSLLRLQDDRIALLYLRKNSWSDCRPRIRFSSDEARTWSESQEIIPDSETGYYVVNNDRMIQLASGRLLIPSAMHSNSADEKFSGQGTLVCYISDDGGNHWQRSKGTLDGRPGDGAEGPRTTLQEPGVVERRDGSVLMFIRTNGGSQYFSTSADQGNTWTLPVPSSLLSPVSPASIERIPKTGDLVAIWNDHSAIPADLKEKRTPLSAAISKDDGKTWLPSRTLFASKTGWYCYTALLWSDEDTLLLAHCAGDRATGNGLSLSQVTRVPLLWLYETP